ncbi:hypothetical protein B0H19DRAFT_907663, partial [Mycena capillaripes]
LREVLRSCEPDICSWLLIVLGSRDARLAVLRLEGDHAQSFLDAVQDVVDRGLLSSVEHISQARGLILGLCAACDQLPSSLCITGVIDREEHPRFGGGFGDIYRASY